LAQNAQIAYASNLKTIQTELDLVLDTYRSANKAVRTIECPSYFETKAEVIPSSDGTERLESVLKRISDIDLMSRKASSQYSEPLGDLRLRIQQYGHAFLSEEFRKYLTVDIAKKATDKISQKN
jgi:hypothetical protein